MQQWEYLTDIFEANAEAYPIPVSDHLPAGEHGKYSPRTLIPQLNELGRVGWELVSMEPVIVGKNEDVMTPGSDAMRWSRHYVCSFKRVL